MGSETYISKLGGAVDGSRIQAPVRGMPCSDNGIMRQRHSIRQPDLRNSAATLVFALHTHPKVVQQQLGHSNISITLDIHSHAVPELQAEAVGKLDAFLAAN